MSSRTLLRGTLGLLAIAALVLSFGGSNAAFAQLGSILVIDDDSAKPDFGNGRENVTPRNPALKGLSADGMVTHLTALGYAVTLETSDVSDPGTWTSYDLVISSTGANGTNLTVAYQDALLAYVQGGGKLLIEGGEVGYNNQTGDFATQVLHIADWHTDNAGGLQVDPGHTGHPIANVPNVLPATIAITYTVYGSQDGMSILPDAFIVYGTVNTPEHAGILVYDNNPNPTSAQIVYYAFNWAEADNRGAADNLLDNTVTFLLAEESGATGGISGTVDLTDTADDSGVLVQLTGPAADQTFTDALGYYEFTGLYSGTFAVTASMAGYYPLSQTLSGIVVTDVVVTDNDFSFDPLVLGSVSGTVTLEGTGDASGVTVQIVEQDLSVVTGMDGIYTIAGVTPDDITVRASKPGYSTETTAMTLTNGEDAVGVDFFLAESGGAILVVDDDFAARSDNSGKVGVARDPATRGLSADGMAAHLAGLGYTVTQENSDVTDPATWGAYDLIITSSGSNGSPLTLETYRTGLETWVLGGGKLLVEGGEVGYDAASSPGYPTFVENVLHCDDWNSDCTAGNLDVVLPGHVLATTPNALPATITVSCVSYTDEDGMGGLYPDAFLVYSCSAPTDAGVLVWDDNPNPQSAPVVYYPFSWSIVDNRGTADNLLENTVAFLLTEEDPPVAGVTGTVDLTDTADDSGVLVELSGPSTGSTYTDVDGMFEFSGIYAGTYGVTVTAPVGYFPYDAEVTGIIVTDSPVDVGTFPFDPIVACTISGTASLSDNPDYSGITVEVVGQAVSVVTLADGLYELTGVNPGDVRVKASKDGYRSGVQDLTLANGETVAGVDFLLEPGSDEFFTDFEADDGGFVTATGGWEWGVPTSGPGGAASGVSECLGYGPGGRLRRWRQLHSGQPRDRHQWLRQCAPQVLALVRHGSLLRRR